VCPNSERKEFGDMEFSLFKKIIDEVSLFAYDVKLFLGGEPLMHPEIFQMIDYAHSHGLVTEIHTNGTLLDHKRSKKILDSGLDVLSISFDGIDKDTYESIRRNADFSSVVKNIKTFLRLKKSKKRNPYTIIQCILQPQQASVKMSLKRQTKGFKKEFEKLPVNEFKFIAAHNFGGKLIDKETCQPKFTQEKHEYHPCGDIYHALSIAWNGKVVPCCTDFFEQYVLGDAKEEKVLDIWNSPKMEDLREKIVLGEFQNIELCRNCEKLYQKQVFGLPRNMLGMFRSLMGRARFIGRMESFLRKILLLKS
jgi:radical SAM protein with 4Fe4S-binding SPASM domain